MYELKDVKIKERRHVINGMKHWDDHKHCSRAVIAYGSVTRNAKI